MEARLEHLITQSLEWALFAVALVTFLESLALVGLLLPGTVMMASLGALVGSGQLGLYPARGAGIVGCLLGDWISYGIGWKFQGPLHRWQYLKSIKRCWTEPSTRCISTACSLFWSAASSVRRGR